MELIQLTPHSDVDPSQPLRAPGDILLHAYLIPNALNPARLARRTGIPATHIKAFIADTHPEASDEQAMAQMQLARKKYEK